MPDIFTTMFQKAELGNWIKDEFRNDRSVGYVTDINKETNMMLVYFPKLNKKQWVQWQNSGHYVVI